MILAIKITTIIKQITLNYRSPPIALFCCIQKTGNSWRFVPSGKQQNFKKPYLADLQTGSESLKLAFGCYLV